VIPNEIKCLICGEKMIITTPARYSTFKVLGDRFASYHLHQKNDKVKEAPKEDYDVFN